MGCQDTRRYIFRYDVKHPVEAQSEEHCGPAATISPLRHHTLCNDGESDEEEDTDAIAMQIMMGLMLADDEDKEDIR